MLAEINQHFVGFSLQPSTELAVKLKCIPTERGYPSSGMKNAGDGVHEEYIAAWASVLYGRLVYFHLLNCFCWPSPQTVHLLKITNNKSVSLK